MPTGNWHCAVLLWLGMCVAAQAQLFNKGASFSTKGVRPGEALVTQYQVGMIITARNNACRGMNGTVPVPLEWPEQEVRIMAEDITPGVQVSYRQITPTVKQMVIQMPLLPPGAEAKALVTFEMKRHSLLPPEHPENFRLATKLPKDVSIYLSTSPGIESTNSKIKSIAKEVFESKTSAWEKVEALYDWTRENVEYEEGPFRGAFAALKAGKGDCEELSSLFIALCRASKVPARTVWIPGHCYPEFYLEDEDGKGHWIPCQAAGSRAFGGMPEFRPILQKGDNFRVPERSREAQRYVAEFLTGQGGDPSVRWVRLELGPDGLPKR